MIRTSFALALCLLPAMLFAQAFEWTTFTSTSNVVDMVVSDGKIWTATSGGLSGYDPATEKFDIYTNTRGLAMNQCVAVGKDDRGFIWAGLADARITRINPQTGEVHEIVDLANDVFEINKILDVGDEVFVAANNGIYRFAYYRAVDNYRVLESIKVLGQFPGEARVTSLAVAGGYLYAGTPSGLARAPLSEAQLNAPGVWQNFTTADGSLPENTIVALQGYEGDPSGLLNIATPSWTVCHLDTTWTRQRISGVIDFASTDYHWAISNATQQALRMDQPQGTWQPTGAGLSGVARIDVASINGQSTVVVGLSDSYQGSGGLVFSTSPADVAWSSAVRAPSIGGNSITALAMDSQGRLWAGGAGFNSGVYLREGEAWRNYTRSTGYTQSFFVSSNPVMGIACDDHGGGWAASQGSGTAWIRGDSVIIFDNVRPEGFSSQGPRVAGILNDSTFAVTRVARSASGDIYMTNRLSRKYEPIIRVPASWIAQGNNPEPWLYYTPGQAPGAPPYQLEVEEMVVDPDGRVWMGPSRDGRDTYVLNTDSSWFQYQPSDRQDHVTCFEDINKQPLSFAVDHQGYLWVATLNGAYYSQGGIPYDLNQLRFICVVDLPVGHQVNTIHVDAQDNKWFGTDNGVAVLDKNFNWIYVFQAAGSVDHSSGLISNNVTAITSNPATGEVWIGTSDGLSRFTSPFVSTDPGLAKLWAYPNPFRADGTQHMRVDPQRLGGRFDQMKILTISGRLVRKLTWEDMTNPGGNGGWDGRNDDGQLVAGGVYLLVVSSNDGHSATGKVAVLGR